MNATPLNCFFLCWFSQHTSTAPHAVITEWYIKSGVAGIFSVCLSSEMFQLTNEERVAVAHCVVEKSGGRVPVIVGATFEGDLEEQASLMREIGQFADAVVIITNQIAAMDEVILLSSIL